MSYANQASTLVFDHITKQISEGIWAPGYKIATEEQLCAALGVSRVAVRQAIGNLSALGVLKKIQGSGTYVNAFEDAELAGLIYYPVTKERIITVLEFRKAFDSYNAELFAKKADDAAIADLKKNYEEMIVLKDNPAEFQDHDNSFHQMIAYGTDNVIIRQISHALMALLIRYQEAQYENIGTHNSIKWHGRILEALSARDGVMAKRCVEIHIQNSIDFLLKQNS